MTRLLSDDDVRARLTPQLALEGARRALVEAHRGGLHAPPRVQAELGAARTGALGAAAVDALALPDADVVGVVLGLQAAAVPDARSAVEGAGIVILATRSETPVIEAPRRRPRRTARRSSRHGSSRISARCSPETRPAGAATRTSRCMRRPASRGRRS